MRNGDGARSQKSAKIRRSLATLVAMLAIPTSAAAQLSPELIWQAHVSRAGQWEVLPESPIYVVHAALVRTGKVIMWVGKGEGLNAPLNSALWDPATGEYTVLPAVANDLFCSHHSFLANGKLIVTGGDTPHGAPWTYVFDPTNQTWEKKQDMSVGRWYPTTVTLPNNAGVITFEGQQSSLEVYLGEAFGWQTPMTPLATNSFWYPGMHLLPNGNIAYVTTRWDASRAKWIAAPQTKTYNYVTNVWADVGYLNQRDRTEGMSVTLPPDNNRVMVIGGRGDDVTNVSTATTEIIDFIAPSPVWTYAASMNHPRRNVNAVLMPTQTVMVTGGIQHFKGDADPGGVLTTEEYDPETNTWTELAQMQIVRQYHSVSLLLPDARILNLGGRQPGLLTSSNKVEIYSPPYLFRGPRPVITSAPSSSTHGATINVVSPDAQDVGAGGTCVLARPGSVTHHTDTDQRIIWLDCFYNAGANVLKVTMPQNYQAISGYYMLFIVNTKRVPSVAKFIQLS
jgi:hypothetical protein